MNHKKEFSTEQDEMKILLLPMSFCLALYNPTPRKALAAGQDHQKNLTLLSRRTETEIISLLLIEMQACHTNDQKARVTVGL